MDNKDQIKELFSDKLAGFEANVRPELWSNISSQIGASAGTAVSGGLSLFAKVLIGTSIAASIGVIGYFVVANSETKKNEILSSTNNPEKANDTYSSNTSNEKKENNSVNNSFENSIQEEITEQDQSIIEDENIGGGLSELPVRTNSERIDREEKNSSIHEVPVDYKVTEESVSENVITETETVVSHGSEEPDINHSNTQRELVLPNVFSPNGDGNNDVLFIESHDLTDFTLVVLDKMNKVVYQTNDPSFMWNGIALNGEMVQEGTYVYYVTARDSSGQMISKYNNLFIRTSR